MEPSDANLEVLKAQALDTLHKRRENSSEHEKKLALRRELELVTKAIEAKKSERAGFTKTKEKNVKCSDIKSGYKPKPVESTKKGNGKDASDGGDDSSSDEAPAAKPLPSLYAKKKINIMISKSCTVKNGTRHNSAIPTSKANVGDRVFEKKAVTSTLTTDMSPTTEPKPENRSHSTIIVKKEIVEIQPNSGSATPDSTRPDSVNSQGSTMATAAVKRLNSKPGGKDLTSLAQRNLRTKKVKKKVISDSDSDTEIIIRSNIKNPLTRIRYNANPYVRTDSPLLTLQDPPNTHLPDDQTSQITSSIESEDESEKELISKMQRMIEEHDESQRKENKKNEGKKENGSVAGEQSKSKPSRSSQRSKPEFHKNNDGAQRHPTVRPSDSETKSTEPNSDLFPKSTHRHSNERDHERHYRTRSSPIKPPHKESTHRHKDRTRSRSPMHSRARPPKRSHRRSSPIRGAVIPSSTSHRHSLSSSSHEHRARSKSPIKPPVYSARRKPSPIKFPGSTITKSSPAANYHRDRSWSRSPRRLESSRRRSSPIKIHSNDSSMSVSRRRPNDQRDVSRSRSPLRTKPNDNHMRLSRKPSPIPRCYSRVNESKSEERHHRKSIRVRKSSEESSANRLTTSREGKSRKRKSGGSTNDETIESRGKDSGSSDEEAWQHHHKKKHQNKQKKKHKKRSKHKHKKSHSSRSSHSDSHVNPESVEKSFEVPAYAPTISAADYLGLVNDFIESSDDNDGRLKSTVASVIAVPKGTANGSSPSMDSSPPHEVDKQSTSSKASIPLRSLEVSEADDQSHNSSELENSSADEGSDYLGQDRLQITDVKARLGMKRSPSPVPAVIVPDNVSDEIILSDDSDDIETELVLVSGTKPQPKLSAKQRLGAINVSYGHGSSSRAAVDVPEAADVILLSDDDEDDDIIEISSAAHRGPAAHRGMTLHQRSNNRELQPWTSKRLQNRLMR